MTKHFEKRQVRDALITRNGPDITDTHETLIGSSVLVYRPHSDRWDGPFSLLDISGVEVKVLLPSRSGRTEFRSTVMKTFIVENYQSEPNHSAYYQNFNNSATKYQSSITVLCEDNLFNKELNVWWVPVPQSRDETSDVSSRAKEFNGLIDRRVLNLEPVSHGIGYRIYETRSSKPSELKERFTPKRSRDLSWWHSMKKHGLLTGAPAVQHLP